MRPAHLKHWEDWLEVSCWYWLTISAHDFERALAVGEVVNTQARAVLLPIRDQIKRLREIELGA
jgi:hypothetical protein